MKKCLLIVALLQAGLLSAVQPKKLIAYGWDILAASPEDILAHADDFDRLPIDGVILSTSGTNALGEAIRHRSVKSDPAWDFDSLSGEVETLRKIVRRSSLRESFLGAWISSAPRLKWTDDAAWLKASGNMTVLARLAREGGLKGLALDPEDYHGVRQFFRAKDDPPYEELKALVRSRGRIFFGAAFDAFPDMTLFSLWIMSLERSYQKTDDLLARAAELEDLWPSFVNGMLDVMPRTVRIVDGDEHSYKCHAGRGAFLASAFHRTSRVLQLIAPENRDLYRSRLSVANAIYPDGYSDSFTPKSWWYMPPVDGSRETHLRLNLVEAMEASDEYVWIYGENGTWIEWEPEFYRKRYASNILVRYRSTWDVRFPGLYRYLSVLRDPKAALANAVRCGRKASDNLIRNPMCRPEDDKRLPYPYGVRCDAKKMLGTYGVAETVGRGEARALYLRGTSRTFLSVREPVRPGVVYVASVFAKGAGAPTACAHLLTESEFRFDLPCVVLEFGEPDADGWRQGAALVHVPHGVTHVELDFGGELTEQETLYYGEPYLGKVSE